jgi:hypothetical protein
VFKFLKNIRLLALPTLKRTLNGMAATKKSIFIFLCHDKTNETLQPGM